MAEPHETARRSWVGKCYVDRDEVGDSAAAAVTPSCVVHDVVRRDPSRSVVNRVLRAHVETLLSRYTDEHGGRSLPTYFERELRAVIACGDLAHGFGRVHCSCCAFDLLVAFSCKGRGFCQSCGGRRMAEFAAHLVDELIPDVPTRQCVLTMPIALRLHLAADPDLLRDVASAFIDAVLASYVRIARAAGPVDGPGSFAHPGAVPSTDLGVRKWPLRPPIPPSILRTKRSLAPASEILRHPPYSIPGERTGPPVPPSVTP